MGVEKELKDFRVRKPLFAQFHVDNDLLRFSYNLTRPPRMADSTLISSNFGGNCTEITRNFTGSERGKALEVLWRAILIFHVALPPICTFIIIIIRYYFLCQSEYRNIYEYRKIHI